MRRSAKIGKRGPQEMISSLSLGKSSGGARAPAGSKTCLTLASLFGTWQARGLNPFIEFLNALQQPTQVARAASP